MVSQGFSAHVQVLHLESWVSMRYNGGHDTYPEVFPVKGMFSCIREEQTAG